MPQRPGVSIRHWACALVLACAAPAFAATGGPPQATAVDALQRAHGAVVGVLVNAADGARSAETLGKARSGSGVVIGADGLVLTIGYLVLEADNVQVVTQDQRRIPASIVAYDLATGFGLLRPLLPLRGIAPAPLGSIASLQPGDALMAATGGEDGDIALTRVVGQRPFSGYWEYHIESALFTSPPIGNHSGAPVFNQRGELMGIGSLAVSDAAGAGRRLPGNMFVPVDLLRPILQELSSTGTTKVSRRPWLGVSSVEQGGSLHVVRVASGSPAEQAGIRPGAVIVAIDGTPVRSLEAFYKKLWDRGSPRDGVTLTVQQDGELRQVKAGTVDRMDSLVRPAGI